jgi:hypothetical protein
MLWLDVLCSELTRPQVLSRLVFDEAENLSVRKTAGFP